jgi:serine protease Do
MLRNFLQLLSIAVLVVLTSQVKAHDLSSLVPRLESYVVQVWTAKLNEKAVSIPKGFVGGGVIVGPTGAILTCEHVIRGNKTMFIKSMNGRMVLADVAKILPEDDLALLKPRCDAGRWLYAKVARDVKKGEPVLTVGHPGRLPWLVTIGIVSYIDNGIIISDAVANPGSSGGAVFSKRGFLVGLMHGLTGPMKVRMYQGHIVVSDPVVVGEFLKKNEEVIFDANR